MPLPDPDTPSMPKGGFRAVRRFGFAVARVRLICLTESRVGAKRKCPECHGNDAEWDAPRGEIGKAFFRLLVWIQRVRREGGMRVIRYSDSRKMACFFCKM